MVDVANAAHNPVTLVAMLEAVASRFKMQSRTTENVADVAQRFIIWLIRYARTTEKAITKSYSEADNLRGLRDEPYHLSDASVS